MIAWLDERVRGGQDAFRYADVSQFEFEGRTIPLLDPQRGIRKPAGLRAALTMRTVFTPPGQKPLYEDLPGPDGLPRYMYRGDNPSHHENVALRQAHEMGLPLVWFVGTAGAMYVPIYPTRILADEPDRRRFVLCVDPAQQLVTVGQELPPLERQYVERLTRQRLHQRVFRSQVLAAYRYRCALCQVRRTPLLDAAHIIPDGRPRGDPILPNGLALCKIHHAAYDADLIGVPPNLVVEVRSDVLAEIDGPMLLHGLQEMAGVRLVVPRSVSARPDPDRLEERYEEFRRAG